MAWNSLVGLCILVAVAVAVGRHRRAGGSPKRALFGGVPIMDDDALWGQKGMETEIEAEPGVRESQEGDDPGSNTSQTNGYLEFRKGLANVTRDSGETVKMRCEAAGSPAPGRIAWYKNEAPLTEEKGRVFVKQVPVAANATEGVSVSKLRIAAVDVHDIGFYRCEVSNGVRDIHSTGILLVNVPDWERGRGGGGNGGGGGDAAGTLPDFSPVFSNFPNLPGRGREGRPEIHLEGNIPGGGSFHIPPGKGLPFPAAPLDDDDPDDWDDGRGRCQVYQGAACSVFLGNRSVFLRSSAPGQGHLEERLVQAFQIIAQSPATMNARCGDYAIPSLCLATFPPCDEKEKETPRLLRLCRDECELLEHDLCRMEYQVAKKHPLLAQHVNLADCGRLPPVGSPESLACIRLGLATAQPIDPDEGCYEERGEEYRGTASRTASGYPCRPWPLPSPASPPHPMFPETLGGHAYCRNPGGKESMPWCYSSSPFTERELCDLHKCDAGVLWLYIVVPCVALVALVLLLLAFWCLRRRSQSARKKKAKSSVQNAGKNGLGVPPSPVEMSALLPKEQPLVSGPGPGPGSGSGPGPGPNPTRIPCREIPLSSIRFIQEIGHGEFGNVYKAEIPVMGADVAVKLVAGMDQEASAKQELSVLASLNHPNIQCFLGVSHRNGIVHALVYEFATQGDLHEFLILHSPRSDVSAASEDGNINAPILEQLDFLHISTQVAAGMEYLSAHGYVHGDLAARNCLVGENLTVKISHLGVSRDAYPSDYAVDGAHPSPRPIRWMAPESFAYSGFTFETDAWSFGVLLWEIWTYGLQPYYGYSNQEVKELVRSRQLLPCPEDCPSSIYAVMVECWHELPSRRATFRELHSRFLSWQTGALPFGCHVGGRTGSHTPSQHSGHTGSTSLSHSHPHHAPPVYTCPGMGTESGTKESSSSPMLGSFSRGRVTPRIHVPVPVPVSVPAGALPESRISNL